MSQLVVNIPCKKVWVRKEYLTDHQFGHGEFVEGVWVTAKSLPGRAFYFETYLPEYAALYDKLPISAFLNQPSLPDPDLDLPNLQFWNCMDYGVECIKKKHIGELDFEVRTRHFGTLKGQYLFSLDNYHPENDIVDCGTSELPEEHKSHNCILLENGQFALYPNNRMRIYSPSRTPEVPKTPDFKVSTRFYQVENGLKWGRLGDTDEYFWQTLDERDSNPLKSSNSH
jgi:hypothetical protein